MTYRKHRTTTRLAVIVAATFAVSATADAQRPASRRTAPARSDAHEMNDDRMTGLSLGLHTIAVPGITISSSSPGFDGSFETKLGPGVGAMVAYGFNRTFSAFASLDLAKQPTGADVEPHGSFGLMHVMVGARANLPLGGVNTVPYVSASVGRRAMGARVTDEDWGGESADMSFSGKSFALGGGIQRFFSPSLAFDGGVDIGFGKLDQLEYNGEKATIIVDGSTSIRFRFGLTWRPAGRRSA